MRGPSKKYLDVYGPTQCARIRRGFRLSQIGRSGALPLISFALRESGRMQPGRFRFIYVARSDEYRCLAGEHAILRFKTVREDMNLHVYWPSACPRCHLKERCSSSDYRRIRRWEHEHVLEVIQRRLDRKPDAMTIRRSTIEHVFGTLKHWMGPPTS
jgi:hypothetical protein